MESHTIEDIRSSDSLFKLFPKKNDLASKVVKICCKQRKPKERRTDFIKRISDELLRFGTSEETVIKFLSNKIWPNNEMRILKLSRNTSIDDLVYHAETLIKMNLKNKNAAKLFCKKCRKNGHLDILIAVQGIKKIMLFWRGHVEEYIFNN